MPSTNMAALTHGSGVSAEVKESRKRPSTMTAEPTTGNIRTWPVRRVSTDQGTLVRGLAVRLQWLGRGATAEIDLGEEGLFWPCDEALARWRQVAAGGHAAVVYEGD